MAADWTSPLVIAIPGDFTSSANTHLTLKVFYAKLNKAFYPKNRTSFERHRAKHVLSGILYL